jgi:hypothetical protein
MDLIAIIGIEDDFLLSYISIDIFVTK